MFPKQDNARVFRLDVGVDLAEAFVAGLVDRMPDGDPLAWSKVEVFVNTQRLGRRIADELTHGPARFHPRIRPITSFGAHLVSPDTTGPLTHRLELAQLLRNAMRTDLTFVPATSAFALADSLLELFQEMSSEGVSADALFSLDVGRDHAKHLDRNLKFVEIARTYFAAREFSDEAARQRVAAERQISAWQDKPPETPVIVVGSTASRGTTAMIMEAVAHLPQGAIILPGFDANTPEALWPTLGEDHPQHRVADFARRHGLGLAQVPVWAGAAPDVPRNRLISLALRPAPVTDAWLREGPDLGDPVTATRNVSLIEAASPREEALCIALELREAVETGRSAAVVSPDRVLTRQVTAMLDRWGILPDDSAGRPLALLPPGQFLSTLLALLSGQATMAQVLAVLKHPLCHSVEEGKTAHFTARRALEKALRHDVEKRLTTGLLEAVSEDDGWTAWSDAVLWSGETGSASVGVWAERLKDLAEVAARGVASEGAGELWEKEAGRAALRFLAKLAREGEAGGILTLAEFSQTFLDLIAREDVREAMVVDPRIKIWGTLEARVQSADIVVLAGLNEDVWPSATGADPWLNRTLRAQVGLLSPERRTGLQAHDFQQAAGAKRIVLSRAKRDGDADTVPSRWVNRITNLMSGLKDGDAALTAMRGRGETRLKQARTLDRQEIAAPKATRPKPKPPVAARPRRLSVTQIQNLVRDPYAIYADKVLGLRALNPLDAEPDARMRGNRVHDILERFVRDGPPTVERLLTLAEESFADMAEREIATLWLAAIRSWADDFVAAEVARQARATPIAFEVPGAMEFPALGFTLSGEADRFDRDAEGRLIIYDYKTGDPPTHKQINTYDRQLLLEAMMAEKGAFQDIPPSTVSRVVHLKVGGEYKERDTPTEVHDVGDFRVAAVREKFEALIAAYLDPEQGFQSRRQLQFEKDERDYDHLARLGEWSESDPSDPGDRP